MKIPATSEDRLATLFSLQDVVFSKIETALKSADAGQSARKLTDLAVQAAPEAGEDNVRSVMSGAFELYRVYGNRATSSGQFMAELFEAARFAKTEALKETTKNESRFADRVARILGLGSAFEIAAKTGSLRLEHERTFCTAKVLTDIRPIFHASASDPPIGGIISHMLGVSYHEGDDLKTVYINLSDMNISGLIAKLERAKLKGRTLASLITKAGVVPVSGDHHHED